MAQFVEKQGEFDVPQDAQDEEHIYPPIYGVVFACVFERNAKLGKGLVSGWVPPDRPTYYQWP